MDYRQSHENKYIKDQLHGLLSLPAGLCNPRLSINGDVIDRKKVVNILGVWISEDEGDWRINMQEILLQNIDVIKAQVYRGIYRGPIRIILFVCPEQSILLQCCICTKPYT